MSMRQVNLDSLGLCLVSGLAWLLGERQCMPFQSQ